MSYKVSLPQIGPYFCAISDTKYRFWCRAKGEGVGVIRYKQSEHTRVHVHAFPLKRRFDNTGVVDLELEANETYIIQMGIVRNASIEQLSVPDLELKWPADSEMYIKTFPKSGSTTEETAFLMGSSRHPGGWFSGNSDAAFASMDAMMRANSIKPGFILMTGGQVFADFKGNGPPSEIEAYFKKYRQAFSSPHFSRVLKKLPAYMIFNDHDIQRQWSIGKYETAEKGFHMSLFSKAILAYQSYQSNMSPVIKEDSSVADAPEIGLSIYGEKGYGEIPFWYEFNHGQCDFFVMDVRTERREPHCMISKQQLECVQEFLLRDPGRKKFIVSSVPVFPDTRPPFGVPADKWTAFPNQRKQLLQFIEEKQKTGEVKDVIFLSGGVHCSFVAKAVFPKSQYSMYSVVSSSFNRLAKGLDNQDFLWEEVRGFPRNELALERKTYGGGMSKVQRESNFAYLSVVEDTLQIEFYSSDGVKLEDHVITLNTQPIQEPERYAVVGRLDSLNSESEVEEKKILAFDKQGLGTRNYY
ncbi:MAG: alkaline phosphatase D family protein [Gammaproteobacteria bacterium]|nr:alkaline phosphatase D family protein [Gammaproteobacteria bacterium]MDH5801946.1 alkaline phosphatase D family protein [Gammaproteobacteria bacterium]